MTDLPEGTVRDVLDTLWLPPYMPEELQMVRIREAIRNLEGSRPRDELEGMLAAQMVATHNAAIECFRRSVVPELSSEKRLESLKQAEKLMSLFTRLTETLSKKREKAAQQFTLEQPQRGYEASTILPEVGTSREKVVQIGNHNRAARGPKA